MHSDVPTNALPNGYSQRLHTKLDALCTSWYNATGYQHFFHKSRNGHGSLSFIIHDVMFDKIHKLVTPFLPTSGGPGASSNRNLTIAITTLYINYAVLFTQNSAAVNQDRALSLLDDLVGIINHVSDSEALYRALVASGTLLAMGEDLRLAAGDVLDLRGALKKAESTAKEPRIKNVASEIRDELT